MGGWESLVLTRTCTTLRKNARMRMLVLTTFALAAVVLVHNMALSSYGASTTSTTTTVDSSGRVTNAPPTGVAAGEGRGRGRREGEAATVRQDTQRSPQQPAGNELPPFQRTYEQLVHYHLQASVMKEETKEELEQARSARVEAEEELQQVQALARSLRADMGEAQSVRVDTKEELQQAQALVRSLRADVGEARSARVETKETLRQAQALARSLRSDVGEARSARVETKEELRQAQALVTALRADMDAAITEAATFKEKMLALNAAEMHREQHAGDGPPATLSKSGLLASTPSKGGLLARTPKPSATPRKLKKARQRAKLAPTPPPPAETVTVNADELTQEDVEQYARIVKLIEELRVRVADCPYNVFHYTWKAPSVDIEKSTSSRGAPTHRTLSRGNITGCCDRTVSLALTSALVHYPGQTIQPFLATSTVSAVCWSRAHTHTQSHVWMRSLLNAHSVAIRTSPVFYVVAALQML